MKKRILTFVLAVTVVCSSVSLSASAKAKTRVAAGTYYDYMCVVTKDGREWLLPDKQSARNPYMKRKVVRYKGKKKVEYMPHFKSGQKVKVTFNTRGTKKVSDDVVISVKAVK